MTMLDTRSGLDRLSPTPASVVEEALQRLESALTNIKWELGHFADADTFKGVKDKARERIAGDFDKAGEALEAQVTKLVETMREEIELELLRLTT